jgi:transposase-like protein
MARGYPPEFRRRVLDLIASGRKVADVARDLDVSGQTIYNWRRQDCIDRGERPGLRSAELAELQAARRRIHELETELAATRRANELLRKVVPPKARFAAIARMAEEGHPAQTGCRVLDVTDSGYYPGARGRPRRGQFATRGSPISSPGSTSSPGGPTGRYGSTRNSPWVQASSWGTTPWPC